MLTSGSFNSGAILLAVLGSSVLTGVVTKILDRSTSHVQVVRDGYAEATRAMVAWGRFPYRVERRVDDSPKTRRALEAVGSDIQERLAYHVGWVSSESPVMGELFVELTSVLRVGVGVHAQRAWHADARTTAAQMSGAPGSNTWDDVRPEWRLVQLFGLALRYRFGWRRYVLPPAVVRRMLERDRITQQARELLTVPPWQT